MGPAGCENLLKAAETIRKVCNLKEKDIPVMLLADLGERERIERHRVAAVGNDLDAAQTARMTGAVAAALQL